MPTVMPGHGRGGWGRGRAEEPVREEEVEESAYVVLGVSPAATQDELKKAYKVLAKKWHPDRAKTDKEKEAFRLKFVAIGNAYDKVKDEEKRQLYDIMERYGRGGRVQAAQRGTAAPGGAEEARRRAAEEAKRARDDEWRARGAAAERERERVAAEAERERLRVQAEADAVRFQEQAEERRRAARAEAERLKEQTVEQMAFEEWSTSWFADVKKTLAEALRNEDSTTIFEQLKQTDLIDRMVDFGFPLARQREVISQFKEMVAGVKREKFTSWSEAWFSQLPRLLRAKQIKAEEARWDFSQHLSLLPAAERPRAQERLEAILGHEQKILFNQRAEKWFTDFTGELVGAIQRGGNDLNHIIEFKREEFEGMLNEIPLADRPQHRLRFEFLVGGR